MAHVLIVGITESGKTTLARNLAAHYHNNGRGVLVLDPLRDPRWKCDFITNDPKHFLDVFWSNRECMAFMDEGGESVGRYDFAMQKTATRGRHWGHSCHYITQKAVQLAPIIRDQCTHLFAFCLSLRDSKALAEEWNKPELLRCNGFKQGEYVHAVKFGQSTHVGGSKNGTITDSRRTDNNGGGNHDGNRRSSKARKGAEVREGEAPTGAEG